ncbi:MAG TPA: hypothetical protein VN829_00580 [Dongiaceae bacterium]|nr:hypothetical protein [Dongiaceae bacterium]
MSFIFGFVASQRPPVKGLTRWARSQIRSAEMGSGGGPSPTAMEAQFTYTINHGTTTITGYSLIGWVGALTIPLFPFR